MISGYERLDVWKLAHRLALDVYRVSLEFPKSEKFGLTQQLRRAAISVPSNIAEGNARTHTREFLHFCGIARGSIAETQYLLRFLLDLEWMEPRTYEGFKDGYEAVGRMLTSLMQYLRRRGQSR